MTNLLLTDTRTLFAIVSDRPLGDTDRGLVCTVCGHGRWVKVASGPWTGTRPDRVTPFSTNATDILRGMGVDAVTRVEVFRKTDAGTAADPMLERTYNNIGTDIFDAGELPQDPEGVADIASYSLAKGLSLSTAEIAYLQDLADRRGRPLTAAEVYGFAQVNSEHCRHKIFNGQFTAPAGPLPHSLMDMIRSTSRGRANLVSAYADNSAVMRGWPVQSFAVDADRNYTTRPTDVHWILKAETHNFPTTVEPFNGAATGTGGEIRDRMCTGTGSLALAGTAVYMTAPPDIPCLHESAPHRPWLYNSPARILVRASDGASDFGNKFGQPLVCGLCVCMEGRDSDGSLRSYDKAVMMAGGVGLVHASRAHKESVRPGDVLIVLGGANYRIGLGGGSVSSADTGSTARTVELQAVQRADPQMQRRVANVVRHIVETEMSGVRAVHDLGAGGNLNALAELMQGVGGRVELSAFATGEPLTALEILCNESQERIAMAVDPQAVEPLREICRREGVLMTVAGTATGDGKITFAYNGNVVFDLDSADLFARLPRKIIQAARPYDLYTNAFIDTLSDPTVGCKSWLTDKVDRSVTGLVAQQQCVGPLQLPIADCAVVASDFTGTRGVATAIGTAPRLALTDPAASARASVAKALVKLVCADVDLDSVVLSANWMWPCGDSGDNGALYQAVEALADFCREIGVAVPTGKDSLSMTQSYPDGTSVKAPGTVIVTAAAPVADVRKTTSSVLVDTPSRIALMPLGHALDGAELRGRLQTVRSLCSSGQVHAMHHVGSGGIITALLEMAFADNDCGGMSIDGAVDLDDETPALIMQVSEGELPAPIRIIGDHTESRELIIKYGDGRADTILDIDSCRERWAEPSFEMDALQTSASCNLERRRQFGRQPLRWRIPEDIAAKTAAFRTPAVTTGAPVAAVIRDKGSNGERELAAALAAAGFAVRDVTMTDIAAGREDLADVRMAAFCGGFTNADVFGASTGWAAQIQHNARVQEVFRRFFARTDTLSLGICNGCQLMVRLGIFDGVSGTDINNVSMRENLSGRFESAFLGVSIQDSPSVMLRPLAGAQLGVWIAHAQGRFTSTMPISSLPNACVAMRYAYADYPGNPNGSDGAVAALCTPDGRHLAMMPHPERALRPWQCAFYPGGAGAGDYTPWALAFRAAYKWCCQ